MARVFVSESDVSGTRVTVTGDDAHHLATVLRLRPGDRFQAIAPGGVEHEVAIIAASRREIVGEITASRTIEPEARLRLTLYQAIPRGKRFPFILQKCTELGVARFVPVIAARTVVDVEDGRVEQRLERWNKIVREACRQCECALMPEVSPPLVWNDALADWVRSATPGMLFHERLARDAQGVAPLRNVLSRFRAAPALGLFVGPEGGFTPEEAQAGIAAGLVEAPLGARILRAETAAIVAVAVCLYESGDL